MENPKFVSQFMDLKWNDYRLLIFSEKNYSEYQESWELWISRVHDYMRIQPKWKFHPFWYNGHCWALADDVDTNPSILKMNMNGFHN